MQRISGVFLGVAFLLVALAPVGCGKKGGGNDPAATNDLKQIGLGYHGFYSEFKRGPANADEFKKFVGENAGPYQGLKDGRYVFIWKANLLENQPTGEVILAYQKDVPTQGGPVLFMDGSTKQMTADEFKSAKIAKAKS